MSCRARSGVTLMARVFGFAWPQPAADVQLVSVVHADDLCVVGDEAAVEPDLGAIVDAGQLEQIRGVTRGCRERRAVPPVLLVEILRHLVEQVLTVVEVRVGAVVLQHLEDGGRHPADGVPARLSRHSRRARPSRRRCRVGWRTRAASRQTVRCFSGGCCGGAKVANDPTQPSSNSTTSNAERTVRRRDDMAISSRSPLIKNRSLDS